MGVQRVKQLLLYVDFIRGLLENVGTDIEPLRLIKRIPDGLEIPGLKDALLKILQDYNLQVRKTAHELVKTKEPSHYCFSNRRCHYMKVVRKFSSATASFWRTGCTRTKSVA